MGSFVSLDPRLSAIEGMIPDCRTVADIGTDHGMLGAHLLLEKRCARVAFSDISEGSLQKARTLIKRLGLDEASEFLVGDGAQALSSPPDVAVIAGMGGLTIAQIIEEGRARLGDALLVLQANVGIAALRARLSGAGYEIVDENIARAAGRHYVILASRPGSAYYTPKELLVGPVLLKKKPEHLLSYARFRARVAEKALKGAQKGGRPECEALAFELSIWKEVVSCLQP